MPLHLKIVFAQRLSLYLGVSDRVISLMPMKVKLLLRIFKRELKE